MKIVINRCWGGFGLSEEACRKLFGEWDGYGYISNYESSDHYMPRNDPRLIAVVEELGTKRASGSLAELYVVDIPDGVDWYIDNYDGMETVHEKHRSWG